MYGFDYSCIKDIALKEPLVDCVELRAVATQPCAIRHIDIKTVTKEELSFKVPFELKATRNDCESFAPHSRLSLRQRRSRVLGLVRHCLLEMPQAYPVLYRSPRQGTFGNARTPQRCR